MLIIVPANQLPLWVLLLENGQNRFLKYLQIEQGSRPSDEIRKIGVQIIEVVGVLGLMLELLIDGEIIELVHILQEPQIVVESLWVFGVVHDFANVEELHVDGMHVDILALVLLQTEIGLSEGRSEHVRAIIFHVIFGNNL